MNIRKNLSLVNFPYEALMLITRHLECSDILSMSRVCKTFHQCIYEDVLNSGSEKRILGRKLCLYKKNGNIKELLIGFYFIGVAAANIDNYTKISFGYNFIIEHRINFFIKYVQKEIFAEKKFSIMERTLMFTHIKSRSLVEKHEAQKKLTLLKTLKNLSHLCYLHKNSACENVLGLFYEIILPMNGKSDALRKIAFSAHMKIVNSKLNDYGDGALQLGTLLQFCPCKKLEDKIFSVLIEIAKGQDRTKCALKNAMEALWFVAISKLGLLKAIEAIERQTRALSAIIRIAKGEGSTQYACAHAIKKFFKAITGLTSSSQTRKIASFILIEIAKGVGSTQYACACAIEQLYTIALKFGG